MMLIARPRVFDGLIPARSVIFDKPAEESSFCTKTGQTFARVLYPHHKNASLTGTPIANPL
jgi:hypothetical protein